MKAAMESPGGLKAGLFSREYTIMRSDYASPGKKNNIIQSVSMYPVYFDCAATTPVEPEIAEVVLRYLRDDFGNAGSRTHEYGNRAKVAVRNARDQVGRVIDASPEEVIFTSGATESNNLAILGLAEHMRVKGKRSVITSAAEHKAVLEPFHRLGELGFRVTYLQPSAEGIVTTNSLQEALTTDTGLVSLMHVNNETGAIQPLTAYCDVLRKHEAFFHVDAAQSFGKIAIGLNDSRIDLVSASAHKLYAPKGVGALVCRRREYRMPPLTPLMYGGSQERSLRPGTLPVPLIAGFGLAAELAMKNQSDREAVCAQIRDDASECLSSVGGILNVSPEQSINSTLSISFPGLDSEAIMVALKPLIAISNGSACTSQNYTASHVLTAMGLHPDRIRGTIRISWSHLTPRISWTQVAEVISKLRI